MASVKLAQTAATALTVSGLSTLANGSSATSAPIDNTTNLYLDYLVEVAVTVGTVGTNSQVLVYAVDSLDGTNYSDSTQAANMRFLGSIQTPTSATAYRSAAVSVAAAFGGTLPPKFEIVITNSTGAAFTAGTAQYIGSYQTVT